MGAEVFQVNDPSLRGLKTLSSDGQGPGWEEFELSRALRGQCADAAFSFVAAVPEPGLREFQHLLKVLGCSLSPALSLRALGMMEAAGLQLNEQCVFYVMRSCGGLRHHSLILQLFGRLEELGPLPSRAVDLLLTACLRPHATFSPDNWREENTSEMLDILTAVEAIADRTGLRPSDALIFEMIKVASRSEALFQSGRSRHVSLFLRAQELADKWDPTDAKDRALQNWSELAHPFLS
jgi:hypothetical protein